MPSLPLTDAAFEFAAPLGGAPAWLQLAVSVAAPLVGLGLLAGLYRYESKRVARPFAVGLLLLRAALLLAAVGAILFDPQFARVRRETVPGRVLVAVDTSDSLRIADLERTLLDKLRIVRALGLAKNEANDAELDTAIRRLEAGENVVPNDRVRAAAARHDTLTRLDIADRFLNDGGRVLAELRKKHAVDVVGFDQVLKAYPPGAGAGAATDLKLPLARAGEIAADPSSKLVGVLLLTDGRHNWGGSPRAADLAARGVPVLPVVLAPDEPPTDVAVTEAVAATATVFQGSFVPVEVAVRATKWAKGPITVSLELPPNDMGVRPPPVTQTVEHPGGDFTHRLTLRVKLDTPGPQTVTVTAKSESAVDRFPVNNVRTVRVNAVKERARVLLVDGEARWEFHYLHTALGRDPNMDVRSVVFRQPRITPASDEEVRRVGIPARALPADVDALPSFDCIILGDVEPEQLLPADRERLEKYVAEAGGTLVIVAGKRAMPTAYDVNDPIRRLIPVNGPEPWSEKLGFRLAPTPDGAKSWFLQLAESRGGSQALWEQFPPHFWAATGEPKAGAEVLAASDGKPIIVRQNFGFGRVLYVAIDSTWRWRYKVGDRYHHRFWGQVAQWAASDRLLPTVNPAGTLRFGTREPAFKPGRPVDVVARATEAIAALPANALKGARIVRRGEGGAGDELAAVVPLAPVPGRPRELAALANDLPPGRYRMELEIPDWSEHLLDASGKRLGADFEVLPFDNEEMMDLNADRPRLAELAAATGGQVFEAWQSAEVIEALAAKSAVVERRSSRPLRSSWWSFGAFLLFLCAEWGVRKWAGLP